MTGALIARNASRQAAEAQLPVCGGRSQLSAAHSPVPPDTPGLAQTTPRQGRTPPLQPPPLFASVPAAALGAGPSGADTSMCHLDSGQCLDSQVYLMSVAPPMGHDSSCAGPCTPCVDASARASASQSPAQPSSQPAPAPPPCTRCVCLLRP